MKSRIKLISTVLTPSAILPLVGFVATSCSQTKTTIAEILYESMISEFYELCKVPRPTYHTGRFTHWIAARVWEIFDGNKDFKGVKFDWNYRPIEETDDYGYNLYFDIPASSSGYEDYPKIILQCHTDMVWQTVGGDDVPDIPIPVMARKDGQLVIHTKDYKTSLGADNGAGIAICLALAKNYKKFNHGPIRVLMTTDEEDGPSGAVYIPTTWLLDCQFLVNLDLEESMRVCQSTAGVQQIVWRKEFTTVPATQICNNGYTIIINGLLGGHSAKAITMHRANSIKLGCYILKRFDQEFGTEGLQLCSVREIEKDLDSEINEGHECPTTPGSIPKYLKVVFASNHNFDNTNKGVSDVSHFQEWLNGVIDDWKKDNPDIKEDKLVVMGDVVDNPGAAAPLYTEDSRKIIHFLDKLPFGYEGDTQTEGVPETSFNIGSLRINDGDYSKLSNNILPVHIDIFARSCNSSKLGTENQGTDPSKWNGMMERYHNISMECWEDETQEQSLCKSIGWNPAWFVDADDELTDILIEGGREADYDPQLLDEHSWLEIGAFAQKRPELDIAAIGPTILDVHSVRETFYVETAKPMFAMLLYAFEHLKKREEVKHE